MKNIFVKIAEKHAQGILLPAINYRIKPYFLGLKYSLHNPGSDIKIHCPEYIEPSQNAEERLIVERIFRAYKLMKEHESKVDKIYRPSSLWQEQLNTSYTYLNDGLLLNDIFKFHFFLANFGTWKKYLGVESGTIIRKYNRNLLGRRYLQNIVFNKQVSIWKWFYNSRKPLSCLSYPMIGNQAGAYIDNIFFGIGSFFNEVYSSLLSELIKDIDHPVVAELGAGYGKLAYFLQRNFKKICFIDFDLPETLCLAAYYLMLAWPNKKTLLYGEDDYCTLSHRNYDLIFMPSWEIRKVSNESVDLFINVNSLGEMTKEAAQNYIDFITKSTKYFFHANHDNYPNIYDDKDQGLLGYQFSIPKNFKQIFRYLDFGHLVSQGGDYNRFMDIFIYLYERKIIS